MKTATHNSIYASAAFVVAMVLSLFSISAFAASGNWNVDAAGNWNTAGNWSPAAVPGTTAGDVVGLNFNLSVARIVTLDTPATVGILNLGDPTTSFFGYTLSTATAQTMTFNNSGSGARLVQATSGGAADTISTPISLADNLVITNVNGLTLSGVISGTGKSITKIGSGTLTLGGTSANTFDGGLTINAGALALSQNQSGELGGGLVTVNNATVSITTGNITESFANNLSLSGAAINSTSDGKYTFTGTVAVNGAVTNGALWDNKWMVFSGVVSGSGPIFVQQGKVNNNNIGYAVYSNDGNTYSGTISAIGNQQSGGCGGVVVGSVNALANASVVNNIVTTSSTRFGLLFLNTSANLGSLAGAANFILGQTSLHTPGVTASSTAVALTVGSNNATTTYSGLISGLGSITKAGSGTMTLSAANTYSGTTTVNAGKLVLSAAQTGTGAATVADGATLGIAGAGSLHWSPATFIAGTTTGTTLEFNLNSATVAPLTPGTLTLNGTTTINILNCPAAVGSYPVMSNYISGTLVLGSKPVSVSSGSLSVSGTTVFFNVNALTVDLWTGAVNGNWDTTTANWTNAAAANVFATGFPVRFEDSSAVTNVSVTAATVSPGGVIVSNNVQNYTISGNPIAGASGLTKSGTGSLMLLGANTFSGAVAVERGSLIISNTTALGAGSLVAVGDGSGNAVTVEYGGNSAAANQILSIASNSTAVVQVDAAGTSLSVNGALSGLGNLTKTGNGTLVLNGDGSGYGGVTTISAGKVSLATSGTASAALGTNTIVLNGTTLQTDFGGGSTTTFSNNFTLNGGLIKVNNDGFIVLGDSPNTTTGTLTINANTALAGKWDDKWMVLQSALAGTGGIIVSNVGGNVSYLDFASDSTYAGTVTIVNGNAGIGIESANALQNANVINNATPAANAAKQSIMFVSSSATIGSLAGSGNFILGQTTRNGGVNGSSSPVTLTVGGNNSNTVYSGNISGLGSLTKAGTGTMTLQGNSTFSGGVTVDGGKLLGLKTTLAGSSYSISLNDGTTLGVVASGTSQLTPASLSVGAGTGATIVFDLVGTSVTPIAAGSVSLNGTLTINIGAAPLLLGSYPLISGYSGGTYALGTLPPTITAANLSDSGGTIYLNVTAVPASLKTWVAGTGNWDTTTSANWTPSVYNNGDLTLFNDTATGVGPLTVTITPSTVTPGSITVSNNAKAYTMTGNDIAGATGLIKQGTNSLTLAASNSFTGQVEVRAGSLVISNLNALGTGSSLVLGENGASAKLEYAGGNGTTAKTISLGNGSAVNFQVDDAATKLTLNSTIGGNAGSSLTKSGSGALAIDSASVTYGGGTVISNGTLSLINAGNASTALGTGSITLAGGTLQTDFGGSPTTTWDNDFVLNSGTIKVNNDGTIVLGSASRTVSATGTTTVGGKWDNKWLRIEAPLTGSGTLNLIGQGGDVSYVDVVTDNNTYNGIVQISGLAGLAVEGQYSLQNAAIVNNASPAANASKKSLMFINTAADFASLAGSGSFILNTSSRNGGADTNAGLAVALTVGANNNSTVVSGYIEGQGSLTKNGTGTMLLTGPNNYSGATTLNAGKLGVTTEVTGGGDYTIADATTLIVTNSNAGLSSLAANNVTLGASVGGSTLELQNVSSTNTPLMNLAGTFTLLNGQMNNLSITSAQVISGKTYPLIKYVTLSTSAVNPDLSDALAVTIPAGVTATLTNDTANSLIALNVTVGNYIPVNTTPTNITAVVSGGTLQLSWPADHLGWHLQVQTNALAVGLGSIWVNIPGTDLVTSTNIAIDSANGAVFFRMVYP